MKTSCYWLTLAELSLQKMTIKLNPERTLPVYSSFFFISFISLLFRLQALNRWGYYPLILIGSWFFGTINRIHDFIEPGHKIFWLSVLDVGMAALMVSIEYFNNSVSLRF